MLTKVPVTDESTTLAFSVFEDPHIEYGHLRSTAQPERCNEVPIDGIRQSTTILRDRQRCLPLHNRIGSNSTSVPNVRIGIGVLSNSFTLAR